MRRSRALRRRSGFTWMSGRPGALRLQHAAGDLVRAACCVSPALSDLPVRDSVRPQAKVTEGPYQMERMLRCLDLGTLASEDLCSEGGRSSGRLSEAS
jgi:hypothetical protein